MGHIRCKIQELHWNICRLIWEIQQLYLYMNQMSLRWRFPNIFNSFQPHLRIYTWSWSHLSTWEYFIHVSSPIDIIVPVVWSETGHFTLRHLTFSLFKQLKSKIRILINSKIPIEFKKIIVDVLTVCERNWCPHGLACYKYICLGSAE